MSLRRSAQSYLNTLDLAPATEKSYGVAINHFLGWMKGAGFHDTRTAIRLYKIAMERDGRLSDKTIAFYAGRAKAFSLWLAETKASDGYEVPDRVKLGMGMPKPPDKVMPSDIRFISDHLGRQGAEGIKTRAIFLLALTCFLTNEEIAAIEPSDILVTDEGSWLTVGVGGARREIPAPSCTTQALSDYLALRDAPPTGLPLFIRHSGTKAAPMTPKLVGRAVSDALKVLRIEKEEAVIGDPQLAVVTYACRLKPDSKRKLAAYAACLYYGETDL